jgi:hypothetical protein
MKNFFIDTANVEYIKSLWEKIKNDVDPKDVRGITTNPNAFFKINKPELSEWLHLLPELCKVVSEIRGDNMGEVYIQGPNSNMEVDEQLYFARLVSNYSNGKAQIGLKIPPYWNILENSDILSRHTPINVTGTADAGTVLKCLSFPNIRYVSIIPGRMEEMGIDANKHLSFLQQRGFKYDSSNGEIISGSMRTINGLLSTFQYGTVPTIGERVWNTLLENDGVEWKSLLLKLKEQSDTPIFESEYCPEVTPVNTKLSTDFFVQMDECGKEAYRDLKYLMEFM